jgi:hypothetical protein
MALALGLGMHTPLRQGSSKHLLCASVALSMFVAACSGGAGANGESVDSRDDQVVTEGANDRTAFEFFVSKGLTHVQAAGIVGNLDQESSMDPSVWQYGGGPGRGIAQWSAGGRWDASYHDNVKWYAANHGASIYSLNLQLEFIWYELTSLGYGYSELRAATTVDEAVAAFQDRYEICGQCDSSNRIAHAEAALSAFGGASSGGGGAAPDACNEPEGFCTETLQCLGGHWIIRQDDPNACSGYHNVEEPCHVGNGYCTATLQCENGSWVRRSTDPYACTSGPG